MDALTTIPQTDPKASYIAHRDAIDAAIQRVLESGWYILGREVDAFEAEFAAFAGASHAVGVANGTDALVLALRAVGVGQGDAVVTVSHTAVATVAAVELVGATPVLIDVDDAYGMDAAALEAVLANDPTGGRIKAVLPVHLYGQPVNLDAVLDLAARHQLSVIEDCSQAHGATWHGRGVGNFGAVAAFSLYPTKNLGALGDGGIVITNNQAIGASLRALRQYGWQDRYISETAGQNSRLDELQAAILRVKLAHLGEANARRQAIAALYDRTFDELGVERPIRRPGGEHVFHQYVINLDNRDALRKALHAQGIASNVHYPTPIHLQPAYRGRVPLGPGGLPHTERCASRILSLPMFPQLDDVAVERIVSALRIAL